jgi:hypothetical protein
VFLDFFIIHVGSVFQLFALFHFCFSLKCEINAILQGRGHKRVGRWLRREGVKEGALRGEFEGRG